MTNQFKVGDQVRCIEGIDYDGPKQDQIYEVLGWGGMLNDYLIVRGPGLEPHQECGWWPRRFEKVMEVHEDFHEVTLDTKGACNLSMEIEKTTVVAKSRILKAEYTLEFADNMEVYTPTGAIQTRKKFGPFNDHITMWSYLKMCEFPVNFTWETRGFGCNMKLQNLEEAKSQLRNFTGGGIYRLEENWDEYANVGEEDEQEATAKAC